MAVPHISLQSLRKLAAQFYACLLRSKPHVFDGTFPQESVYRTVAYTQSFMDLFFF